MTSSEIRNSFLKFFEQRGHTIVPSAPVIPYEDPTLLFTNAGMNQFKDVFLGTGKRSYKRAVDTQKCIRVSGKHNDLEEVGRDTYHHTFFEMLGNWSFGDYYKKEAIEWAWELLTKVWGLPKNRLWATVYKDDEEAEQLWKKVTDIDPSHVLRFGEKDNFWEMGETGPCGPCSEIHMDRTQNGTATAAMVNAGVAEVMEIWNLVFIQYERDASGKLTPLPAKHVDTGMGFERICALLQGKDSNYDTDVFMPVIGRISEISKKPYSGKLDSDTDIAMRVIADHVRALTFAIADGAIPSNEGRGYVLRRILRRAARFGRNLGMHEPFIHNLVSTLVETMGSAFPEIKDKSEHIQKVIRGEEDGFNATLDRGLEIFEEVVKRTKTKNSRTIDGEEVFRLYDTFGFPIDLTALLAREQELNVDEVGFHQLMDMQRDRSRESSKYSWVAGPAVTFWLKDGEDERIKDAVERELKEATFEYNAFQVDAQVLSSPLSYTPLNDEKFKRFYSGLVLDSTTFYAESGGQVRDVGSLDFDLVDEHVILDVLALDKRYGKIVHVVKDDKIGINELLRKYVSVKTKIDVPRRNSIMRNHTATHLVHEALRRVLGEHLHQHGSLVDDKHLRFDFNHFDKVKPEELHAIEEMVNQKIAENIAVNALNEQEDWVTIEEAKKRWPNVKMFFGDKYGDRVRVVEIDPGFSVELCGGTHVKSTGDIGYFKFRTEGSVASGIRRIEAVTHDYAYELLKIHDASLLDRIEYALRELDESYRTLDELNKAGAKELAGKKEDLLKLEERLHKLKNAPTFAKTVDGGLALFFKQQSNRLRIVEDAILGLLETKKALEKELGKYRLKSLSGSIDHLVKSGVAVNGFKVVSSKVAASNNDELKSLGDTLRSRLGSGVGLLAAVIDDKVSLVCVVTDDLVAGKKVEAGKIVGAVAKLVGGGGGGRPHMATAGGKDVAKLDEALAKTKSIVESFLHQS